MEQPNRFALLKGIPAGARNGNPRIRGPYLKNAFLCGLFKAKWPGQIDPAIAIAGAGFTKGKYSSFP
jgi:hypothetical protein